jgi:hypothetical protein
MRRGCMRGTCVTLCPRIVTVLPHAAALSLCYKHMSGSTLAWPTPQPTHTVLCRAPCRLPAPILKSRQRLCVMMRSWGGDGKPCWLDTRAAPAFGWPTCTTGALCVCIPLSRTGCWLSVCIHVVLRIAGQPFMSKEASLHAVSQSDCCVCCWPVRSPLVDTGCTAGIDAAGAHGSATSVRLRLPKHTTPPLRHCTGRTGSA